MGGFKPVPAPDYSMVGVMNETERTKQYGCPQCGAPPGEMCVRLSGFTRLLRKKPRHTYTCHDSRKAKRILAEGS